MLDLSGSGRTHRHEEELARKGGGDLPRESPVRADRSETAVFAHNATRFYVGVTVMDDVVRHENPYSWQGDGVVVLFDADQTTGRTQRQTIASWNQRKQAYAADEAALVKWEQVR